MFIFILELNNILKVQYMKAYLMATFHLCYKEHLWSTLPCLEVATRVLDDIEVFKHYVKKYSKWNTHKLLKMEHLFNNIFQKHSNLNPYITLETCQIEYMTMWRRHLMWCVKNAMTTNFNQWYININTHGRITISYIWWPW